MPRGIDRYDEARQQGRLWTPGLQREFLYAWYDAADVPTIGFFDTTQQFILSIKDKSGLGNNATVLSNSPYWYPYRIENFATGNDYLSLTLPASTYDVAFTGKLTTNANDKSMLYNGDSSTWPVYIRNSDNAVGSYHTSGSTFAQAGSLTWVGGQRSQLWATIPGTTGVRMAMDGGDLQDETGEVFTNTAALRMGSFLDRLFGEFNEVLFFPPSRSEAFRRKVEGYLAHKWDRLVGSLRESLAPGHPFKNRPPLIGD